MISKIYRLRIPLPVFSLTRWKSPPRWQPKDWSRNMSISAWAESYRSPEPMKDMIVILAGTDSKIFSRSVRAWVGVFMGVSMVSSTWCQSSPISKTSAMGDTRECTSASCWPKSLGGLVDTQRRLVSIDNNSPSRSNAHHSEYFNMYWNRSGYCFLTI